MSEPILTIYNRHTPTCGNPPALSNAFAELYVGYLANRHGDQWFFTFDRATRATIPRAGDADCGRAPAVHDGRVDGLVLAPEDVAWLPACWRAAVT